MLAVMLLLLSACGGQKTPEMQMLLQLIFHQKHH